MRSKTERLERDILRVFRCACGQERPDIAEFMLAALEKLDSEREDVALTDRPLMEAYMDVADIHGGRRFVTRFRLRSPKLTVTGHVLGHWRPSAGRL